MEDIKLPKASSFKTGMVYAFTAMTKLKEENFDFTANSLIIVTATGIIYGTPYFSLPKDNTADILMDTVHKQAQKMTLSEVPKDTLILKNVTLITSAGLKQSFETLFVFPDDIIAITVGKTVNL